MVYANAEMAKKSMYRASKEIGVTRTTLERWILLSKVRAKKVVVGGRTYWEIDDREIERVKKIVGTDRPQGGKSLI